MQLLFSGLFPCTLVRRFAHLTLINQCALIPQRRTILLFKIAPSVLGLRQVTLSLLYRSNWLCWGPLPLARLHFVRINA